MKLKKVRRNIWILLGIALVFFLLGFFNSIFLIIALIFSVVVMLYAFTEYRCPYCDKFFYRIVPEYCPYCGKKLDE